MRQVEVRLGWQSIELAGASQMSSAIAEYRCARLPGRHLEPTAKFTYLAASALR